MVEHDDEAIHRLRASDPATGSHPDLHRLRSLIAQKAPASQGADRATAVDDELLRGPRLRTPWVAAAAVAELLRGRRLSPGLPKLLPIKVLSAAGGGLVALVAAPAAPGRTALLVLVGMPVAGFLAPDAMLQRLRALLG